VLSGRESINTEYEEMLHRESRMMSLYNDDIVKQFFANNKDLIDESTENT
jgi:hypothetical protein